MEGIICNDWHRGGLAVAVKLFSCLTLVLGGVDVECHALAALRMGRRPSAHGRGGWVGPMDVLDLYGEE